MVKKIKIDGIEIEAKEDETILEAALRNGIHIPNLCYDKKLSCSAACRLCIVDIENRALNVPSCATKAEDGMIITAFSERLEKQRKVILDLMLSMHNDDCINCVRDGDCELQNLAFKYDLGKDKRNFPAMWELLKEYRDNSSQVLNYDSTKCIQCQRCIKACWEIQSKGVLSFENRGIATVISTGYKEWAQSQCDGCGECIQSCPVGALSAKFVYDNGKRHRTGDFDSVIRTTCPYCGVGCQLDIAVKDNSIVSVRGADVVPNNGSTCVKGRFGLQYVSHKERLKYPLIKKNGKFVEVSWEEAIFFATSKIKEIKEKYGSNAIGGMASARCTNEENYLFQKFMRTVINTNNVDHCARLCHASTVAGLASTIGSGAMTNSISDFEEADVILLTGSNTTETHPVISNFIKRAVLKNRAKLIVIDPRKIDLVRYATIWLRPENGTDIAWINGLMHVIIKKNLQKDLFIKERTVGFEELKITLEKYTPEYVEKISAIPADKLITAAEIFGNAHKGSIVWAMGITQHVCGTGNVKSLVSLALLTGNIGRIGTGLNPLRGQNNVQGACDMGALPDVYPGSQKLNDVFIREKFEKFWNTSLSSERGLTLTEMIKSSIDGKIKALYIMGENSVISDPNSNHCIEALKSLELLITQDIFLSETSQFAHVVFPALSSLEKDGTFTNTERRVLPVRKVLTSTGKGKEDWRIIQLLANAMGIFWDYKSWKDILSEINLVTPQYAGITPERVSAGESLQWPCTSEDHPGTPIMHIDKFTNNLGIFSIFEHQIQEERSCEEFPFVMSTGRVLYHYHTGTMTRKSDILNNFIQEPYFEMNKEDMNEFGIYEGETVRLFSRRGKIDIKAVSSEKVDRKKIFVPFHFAEAAANKLTLDSLDPISKIPELKVCAVKIQKMSH